jgi:hypothetical protein
MDGFFLTHPTPFIPHPQQFALPSLNTFYQLPMAYFNNTNDAGFYSTFPTPGEFDGYPFLGQMSANEEANASTTNTFADGWNVGRQPDYMAGLSRSLQAEASLGKPSRSLLDKSATYA